MKKRITAVIMVFVLFFTIDVKTLYAVNGSDSMASPDTIMEKENKEENFVENQQEDEIENPGISEAPEEPKTPEVPEISKTPGSSETPDVTEAQDKPELREEEVIKKIVTVDFHSDGGSEIGQLQIEAGQVLEASQIEEPMKKGYHFRGWMTEDGTPYVFQQPVTENITLTAQWFPITYKIKFHSNRGTGNMGEIKAVLYDQEIELPENCFTRKGYLFEGWELVGGYQEFSDGASVKNLKDQDGTVTLKAIWSPGNYKIRFNRNGGTGNMKELALIYDKTKTLLTNKYKRTGYFFTGWNTAANGTGIAYQNKQKVKSLTEENKGVVVLYAMWQGVPYQVKYNGNGAGSGKVNASQHTYGINSKLSKNTFKRKGYTFAGWNTKADGSGTTYPNAGYVQKLTTQKDAVVQLYAKWKSVKYTITYAVRGGKLNKSSRKNYTVTSKTFTLPAPTRKGYDFDGWYTDSKCKKRIGQIKKGRTGNLKVYAKWVKGGVKAKANSAKITYCSATQTNRVKIKASIKKRVASTDDYYYLVYMNPTNKVYKMAAKTYKKTGVTFQLNTAENQGYVTSKFGIAVKKNGKYTLISPVSYVKNPEKAARNKSSYKLGSTKKGIQLPNGIKELENCKAKNTFFNLTVSMVYQGGSIPYQYNGKTYFFNDLAGYRQIVSACNRKKINVTAQIMLDWTDGYTDMIAPKARIPGAAPYYTWNISSSSAREKMEAMFCYLGKVFGEKNCYISNWILGNEVNNPNGWNYKGWMTDREYFRTYAYCFRALYYAVRSQYSNAHVFICVDNVWNISVPGGYGAKTVITSFVKELNRIQKGLKWNLAYHAYSVPLTNTTFWNGFAITNDIDTSFISMKNLNVLTDYIKKKYGSSVRVILSEQGYSSDSGQNLQAAALAYSYYIAACNPMVDSFIIRSYSDHPVEVAQGLSMGIEGKEAFEVFKYMDTTKAARYTNKFLPLIGANSWKQIVPGYSASKIRKMYRKL